MTGSIGIIGAGWAGLALAARLSAAGRTVTVLEASRLAGGRARDARIRLGGSEVSLDNGQHMMIGAYREALALLRRLHGDELPLHRLPLQFESGSFSLRQRGPGRLGLLAGLVALRGGGRGARRALLRIGRLLSGQRWQGFEGLTVETLLERTRQPQTLTRHFWRPFCLAAMNTPPQTACAQTFVNVLHDALMAAPEGSDFLIPTVSLGALMAEPLTLRLASEGVTLLRPWPVRDLLASEDGRWHVMGNGGNTLTFDTLVLACGPRASARLLGRVAPEVAAALSGFDHHEIRTAYLAWPEDAAPALPTIAMLDDEGTAAPGQWLFSRGVQAGLRLASVVVSVSDALEDVPAADLDSALMRQIQARFGGPLPVDVAWVRERHATIACVPGRPAPDPLGIGTQRLPAGLALCGDHCLSRYPSTLEGALLSAAQTAEVLGVAGAGE